MNTPPDVLTASRAPALDVVVGHPLPQALRDPIQTVEGLIQRPLTLAAIATDIHERTHRSSSVLKEIQRRCQPAPRWGLNE
ncbi:MAG: hypothetical protein HYR88_06070 [Verrucomicrobia bacterium]|nr:hypothetical protein [Verrucomicrobiota bacterium]MBI3868443.1 hypothetical protein [Verrucomicrobiota bacterium]